MSTNILFNGEIHSTLGSDKLYHNALNYFQPEIILLETEKNIDQQYDAYMKLRDPKNYDQLLSNASKVFPNINEETFKEFLKSASGYIIPCVDYAREHNIPIHEIDEITESAEKRLEKTSGVDIAKSAFRYLKWDLDKAKEYFKQAYDEKSNIDPYYLRDVMYPRDKIMETNIKKYEGRIFVSAGIDHIFGNYHNLYDRFHNIEQRDRKKLIEFGE